MPWTKSPPELVERFDAAAPEDPRVVRRPMFGYPALYLDGNMFAGTYQDKLFVRLSEDGRRQAMESGAGPFEPMAGRPMKEYVVLAEEVVADSTELARWVAAARDYASTLPPKGPGKRSSAEGAPASPKR